MCFFEFGRGNTATGTAQSIETGELVTRQDAESLMLLSLIAGLSRGDLRDLIRFRAGRET